MNFLVTARDAFRFKSFTLYPNDNALVSIWDKGTTITLATETNNVICPSFQLRSAKQPFPKAERLIKTFSWHKQPLIITQTYDGHFDRLSGAWSNAKTAEKRVLLLLDLLNHSINAGGLFNSKDLVTLNKIIMRATRSNYEGERETAFAIAIERLSGLLNWPGIPPDVPPQGEKT